MKYFLILFVVSGCGAVDRMKAHITGEASQVCVKGVVYYQFTSGSAPAYKPDGTLRLCD